MSTINIANHTSVINSSCVPPKFNHHHKQQWLASPVIILWNIQRHACEKLTTDFYKTEKSGEKDYSTELYIN